MLYLRGQDHESKIPGRHGFLDDPSDIAGNATCCRNSRTGGPCPDDRAMAVHRQHGQWPQQLVEQRRIAQVKANGLIGAAFEHWDSRAGDPNLHTHVAISTKVQGADGQWRSLDARAL